MTESGSSTEDITSEGGAMDIENSFGLELRGRRLLLGYSVKKLSKLSGISRRWIACAEQGSNITVDVLRKLMQTMNMTVITICPGITASTGAADRDITSLAEAVDQITSLCPSEARPLARLVSVYSHQMRLKYRLRR
jgi:transcriptional regulator with XRE-family HTH domain